MRKKILIASLASIILIWFFTGDSGHYTQNKLIKKITETTALQLFGKINFWVFSKDDKLYNRKGQIISSYYDGSGYRSKYIYSYTKFDSIQKIIWLAGKDLIPQEIDVWTYDSLNRPCKKLVYEVKKSLIDTCLVEKTTYLYDQSNRRFKTVIQHFSKEHPSTEIVSTFVDFFNEKGLVAATRYTSYLPNQPSLNSSTNITRYIYNAKGYLIAEFGGITADSISYKRNSKGKVTEEISFSSVHTVNRKWYDSRGNKIQSYLDIGNGREHTYEYKYDRYNRLIKELRPGGFYSF